MEKGERKDVPLSEVQLTEPFKLTRREGQILAALSRGLLLKQAAHDLGMSYNTAKVHATSIRRKVGTGTVAKAAARYLTEMGQGDEDS